MGFKNNDRCLDKVDDDEPIFVLRAQDASMIDTILDWLRRNPGLPVDRYIEVNEHIKQTRDWQLAHPDRVKVAD
jgi:hypothetical protein